jgi:hypothetical protein
MVAAYIFILHFILILFAFRKNKKDGIGEGFLSIAFVIIVFAVGWTIATLVTNLLFSIDWFNSWYWQPLNSWICVRIRKEFNRDTLSLLILTAGEIVFYYLYFLPDIKKLANNITTTESKSK